MDFIHKKLKNGINVYLLPDDSAKTVTLYVGVKVGSRYETKQINGISHFIEHLMFKGTKKRPNQLLISKELDAIGAQFNAYTAKDRTVYYASSIEKNFAVINDVLADMVQNSLFDVQAIEKEKGVIVEEIHMYHDNPLMYIEDLVEELSFGDSPLAWDIAGTEEIVKSLNRDDIVSYYKAYYHPENINLVVAGKFDKDKVFHQIDDLWSDMPKADLIGVEKELFNFDFNEKKVKLVLRDSKQVQMGISFPAYSYTDPKRYASTLLSIILGANMSSRLFVRIREEMSLAYLIRSYINTYEDTGLFIIQAGLEKNKIKDAIKGILSELKDLKENLISDIELKNAKTYLEGKLKLRMETSENNASWLMEQVLFYENFEDIQEYLEHINQVQKEDIQAIANEIFEFNKLNLVLLGDVKEKEDELNKLLDIK